MKSIINDVAWFYFADQTPLNTPGKTRSESEAMTIPGCYVLSLELDCGWPKFFGRLTRFDRESDRAIVISAPVHDLRGDPKRVWIDTISEYLAFWRCD